MISRDSFQITPIPIETAYFLSDAAKFRYEETDEKTKKVVVKEKLIRDRNKFNRYYFNYLPEWKTSNVGESIIGVRSMWTMNKNRVLSFAILVRKYKKEKFYEAAKKKYPKYKDIDFDTFRRLYISDDEIQQIVNEMDEKDIMIFPYKFMTVMKSKESLHDLIERMNDELTKQSDLKETLKYYVMNTDTFNNKPITCNQKLSYIEALNKYNTKEELLLKYNKDFWMNQDYGFNKDISFIEVTNDIHIANTITSVNNPDPNDSCYVDVMICKGKTSYNKKYESRKDKVPGNPTETTLPSLDIITYFNEFGPKSRSDPEPLTEEDEFGQDFDAVFNICNEPWQNSLDYITTYHRRLTLKNIYTRESLKVHASFGNPSNNYYIGNSHVYFDPIKYYKLNSKDDKFWIEFYSGRYHKCPVNIPEDEGFVLEMLFMQNQKLLYT